MKLEIVCRETIKPLFSTPPELGLHHLCLFDRQAPFLYLQFLYFYENTSNSKLLKESLSKALILYYPFAGRLKDRASIDCNDMGVTFLEAKLRCPMSEFMNADDSRRKEILKLLCFDDMNGKDQRFNPLLCIQLTRFECGGEAICVFLSHKLADTLTFTNFMSHWASISCSSGGGHDMPPLAPPQFNAASLFKPDDDDLLGLNFYSFVFYYTLKDGLVGSLSRWKSTHASKFRVSYTFFNIHPSFSTNKYFLFHSKYGFSFLPFFCFSLFQNITIFF